LASAAAQGGGVRAHYIFRGHLLATPPANATSISLTVEGGNRIALKAMLGASVDQNFAVGTGTEFLRWSHGVPTVVHANDLRAGDWLVVNVRAPYGSSLAQIESRPAGIVSDRVAKPNRPTYPLFLFRGRVAAPAGTSRRARPSPAEARRKAWRPASQRPPRFTPSLHVLALELHLCVAQSRPCAGS